jgi:hypothetical protein
MEKIQKECLVLGNGKSLWDVPDFMLKTYPSFGVNYCLYQPNFYVCVDHDILVNHQDEIYGYAKCADFAFLAAKEKGIGDLYELPNVRLLSHDTKAFKAERYFSGMTVVYVALKMAYYLGFETVHLWGVDHSLEWSHYRSDYPAGDVIRRGGLMAEMEYHYQLAADVYNRAGKRILNHSYPSNLDAIFER